MTWEFEAGFTCPEPECDNHGKQERGCDEGLHAATIGAGVRVWMDNEAGNCIILPGGIEGEAEVDAETAEAVASALEKAVVVLRRVEGRTT